MAELTYPTSIDLTYLRHALADNTDTTVGPAIPSAETAPTSIDLDYLKKALAE